MSVKKYLPVLAIVVGLLCPVHLFAALGGIDSSNNQSRLCSNADCSSYTSVFWTTSHGTAVSVSDTGITGDVWSAQLGWINLNPTHGGVNNTTAGSLSGYAWGQTAGWVNFSPAHGGVTINPTTGEFSGYAWVSGGGWMRFDCSLGITACVKTTWRPDSHHNVVGVGGGGGSGSGGNGNGTGTGTTTTTGTTGDTTTTTETTTTTTTETTTTVETTNTTTGTTGTTGDGGTGATTGEGSGVTTGGGVSGGSEGSSGGGTGIGIPSTIAATVKPGETIIGGSRGCPTITATDTASLVSGEVQNSLCQTQKTVQNTADAIKKVFQSQTGGAVAKTVTTASLVGGASITIATQLFLNPLSFSEIFLIPARLWSLLMSALGLKKRRRPWGTVYDSITKQPLDPAYVTLKTSQGAEVISSITDLDGRFGFVVTEPGDYSIFVHKTNYLFPSQKLVGQDHDELYRDLYFGEIFHVANAGDIVIKNIPMDPEKFDWNEFAKKQQKLMKFYSRRDKIVQRLLEAFFAFGFIVAIMAVIAAPKIYNILIFCMYVVLFFVRRHNAHSRPYGDVLDAKKEEPLSYALIRISHPETGVEMMHRIADARGRYYALLPNGEYRVRIDCKLPDGSYKTVASNLVAVVSKGYLSKKFLIDTTAPLESPKTIAEN